MNIVVDTGDNLKAGYLPHYSCCWGPFKSKIFRLRNTVVFGVPLKAEYLRFTMAIESQSESREHAHYSCCCWGPFDSRALTYILLWIVLYEWITNVSAKWGTFTRETPRERQMPRSPPFKTHHWLQMHGHLTLVSKAKMIWHVECDASNVGGSAILSQTGRPITFLSRSVKASVWTSLPRCCTIRHRDYLNKETAQIPGWSPFHFSHRTKVQFLWRTKILLTNSYKPCLWQTGSDINLVCYERVSFKWFIMKYRSFSKEIISNYMQSRYHNQRVEAECFHACATLNKQTRQGIFLFRFWKFQVGFLIILLHSKPLMFWQQEKLRMHWGYFFPPNAHRLC